jgi:metallo-beta-lactamase class B
MKQISALTLCAGLALLAAADARVASAQGKRPADLSGASAREIPPIHMFDNLWYVGSSYVSSYILKTSAGLIMIDSNYGDFPPKTVEAMKKEGLNAKDVKYLIITHGHIDHFGGAKLIQSLSDARIGLTEADWALMEKSNRGGADAIVHKGDRDMVIRDGDVLTLGDTTLKFYITPGHTPGVASMEFPVYDQGKKYKAFLFGGHNVTSNHPEAFEMFIASVKRLQATLQDVDVSLTSHPWAADILERSEKLAARRPGDPNPYVAPAEFKAFLQERLEDAQTRLAAAKKPAAAN